jgi:hypothetical protein
LGSAADGDAAESKELKLRNACPEAGTADLCGRALAVPAASAPEVAMSMITETVSAIFLVIVLSP